MSLEKNKALVRRFNDEVWTQGKLEVIDELSAVDVVWHAAQTSSAEALKERVAAFRSSFPDVQFTTEDLIAAGDRVVTRTAAQGTHKPTGKQATWTAIVICRIADGKIAEVWSNEDMLGRMQQIGYKLVPTEDAEP